MMNFKTIGLVSALAISAGAAQASTWDWSFAGETGTFETDGTGFDAGTYTLTDFTVTSSSVGATIGSLMGGDYSASGFSDAAPYSFSWDGSAITALMDSGNNSFDWFVFDDQNTAGFYLFGWESGNINTLDQAVYWMGDNSAPSFTYSVTPAGDVSPVPLPASALLLIPALGGLAGLRRRSRKKAA